MNRMLRSFGAIALLLLAVSVSFAAPAPEKPFTVQGRITIGGEGGWDCLAADAVSRRVFLSHGARVVVVDTRTDSIVGEIGPTPGVHDIAFARELGRGWTSNGRDSSVTVFDFATLKTLASIKLPARGPDVMAYDAASGRVFVFNGGSNNASVIDARTNAIVGSVSLGGKPEFAVTDGAGRLWVNLEDSSAVLQLDTRTLKVLATWPLGEGKEPSGLAFDRVHHRLFSACGNQKLVVLDSGSGRIVATLPIGQGVDGCEFDALRSLVFTPNGSDGTLTVIHEDGPDQYRVVETATTEKGARTMTLDEKTGRLYLPTADFGTPPPPTPERQHPRPPMVPGSFRLLVVGR